MAPKCLKVISKAILRYFPAPQADDDAQRQRLNSFSNVFMISWAVTQTAGFCIIIIAFLFSNDNRFMKTEDCCSDLSLLYNSDTGLPIEDCSQQSCKLYNFAEFKGVEKLNQNLPRTPRNGDYSRMFDYDDKQYCCNLDESSGKCCSRLTFGASCGSIMWAACVSAVSAMIMTQIVLQGYYGLLSRKWSFLPLLGVIFAQIFRALVYCIIFYIFFAFLFCFIFFWVPYIYCDNPHAYDWYKFGYLYLKFFFLRVNDIFLRGASTFNGKMDMNGFVGVHAMYAMVIDGIFTLIYICLHRVTDEKSQKYFDLGYFKL